MTLSKDYVFLDTVTKKYPGMKDLAVSQASLTLRSGEILALLGPNGAGKTTVVKMIAGLIVPTSGVIRVMDHDMVNERQHGVRHIGAVLEGARNLYWRLTAMENLLYFGSLRLVPHNELRSRIDELLALVGLTQFQDKEVGKFSRGMQQKLAIAAALLHDPNVLLLDEPTLGLDVQAARQLEKRIVYLAKSRGKAILLTTHMLDLAEKLADQIYVINRGRKVVYDSTKTLLERYNTHRDVIEIEIDGIMPKTLASGIQDLFQGLTFTMDNKSTLITWPEGDQGEVIQLMSFLSDKGMTIFQVSRRRANLEEVFLSLTELETAE